MQGVILMKTKFDLIELWPLEFTHFECFLAFIGYNVFYIKMLLLFPMDSL